MTTQPSPARKVETAEHAPRQVCVVCRGTKLVYRAVKYNERGDPSVLAYVECQFCAKATGAAP